MTCSRGCCPDQRTHYLSIGTGPRSSAAREQNNVYSLTDRRWERDHAAYRRLRSEGLQPDNLDGAAEMEAKARTNFEIEAGVLIPKEEKNVAQRVQRGRDISRQIGMMITGKDEF